MLKLLEMIDLYILFNTSLYLSPDSGALARAKSTRSGAPWVTKFGKLSIRENLVMT